MVTETTLSSAWDQHLASELAARSPEQALATMTAEPYVNVVPLMIGARGPDCSRSSSETERGDSRADTRRAPVG